jgi:transposase
MALTDKVDRVVDDVATENIGFAPILRYYFEKAAIAKIIDDLVPIDPRRKVLTHGQAAVAMITAILFQVMQLYRLCPFARQSTVLDTILTGIAPEAYFDDRLADSLDALFRYGLGNLELQITGHMIEAWQIQTDVCHNDTTSASYYGGASSGTPGSSAIQISFGHSKKHRDDLKQLVWSMSVSNDSAFPLFSQAYSGNTADVNTYVEQWQHLIDLLDRSDFLYVADCKLISAANIAAILDNGGHFLAPAPMYESYANHFQAALADHDREVLLPHKGRFNRGFELPMVVQNLEKDYRLRMIIIFDQTVARVKRENLHRRVEQTRAAFETLKGKLNSRNLKYEEQIRKACDAILKKYGTGAFFTYRIDYQALVTYKNKRRGRPSPGKPVEKVPVRNDVFSLRLEGNDAALAAAMDRCGYYPLLTDLDAEHLSIEQAMAHHKGQYKNEHTFRRAKGPFDLEPIYLHRPERIEAYLFLFKIALQIVALIERTARANIQQQDRGLDELMPNRKDVRNPRAEYLLAAFEHVVKGTIPGPAGANYGFVSKLTALQQQIITVLEVPATCFSYRYLADSS